MAAAGFTQPMGPTETVRIKRFFYQHILDTNTNVTRCLVGPMVYVRKDYEVCLFEPKPCVSVPSRCYCRILNPCERDAEGQPIVEPTGQVRLRMGDAEIRFDGNPFPLYPGEECQEEGGETILKLQDIPVNKGYHVRCIRDFKDESGALVKAGSSWMERGPKTYIPRVEVTVERVVEGHIIKPNTALQLRAQTAYVDSSGAPRVAGETWLVRTPGAYLPAVEEEVLGVVHGVVLTPKRALHLRAKYTFTDVYGVSRRAGEMWMVTNKDASVHIVDVSEEKVQCVDAVTLTSQQYCVILNPVDETGKNRYGEIRTRCGECTFFLHPDEELRDGVQDVLVAGMDEALLLKAVDDFQDGDVRREAGSMWMIYGPVRYVPTNDVQVMEHRRMITLDKNEGVYVKDTTTGEVRSVIGQPYMLKANEVLWNKQLTTQVEQLLECPEGSQTTSEKPVCFKSTREKHKVVRFNVQHNAAIQIYDYRTRESRIVLGPSLVMLAPHEDFTVLTLSGGKPKVPDTIQSLQLFLGPRFSSDTIVVETSDHARLRLHMSYNWHFDVDRASPDSRIFFVPDFIGDCCKTIASQVRGAVAGEDFDSFHRNSAEIIRAAVFGTDDAGNIRKELYFTANRFVVTNIDIQSVEPTDEKTRDSLQKSVQLAIEITTKSQEASARHGNERKDQEAKGQLERQKLRDQIEVEKARTNWLKLQAESESMQAKGQSVAEATAKAEALLIEVKSELHQAQLRAQAYRISADSELKKLQQRQKLEQEYTRRQFEMEVDKARQLADAEADKVKRMVDAIGRETLVSIARAGPETQAKLLGSLGLKGYLITDGNSPVNLFNTAQGIIGGGKDMTH